MQGRRRNDCSFVPACRSGFVPAAMTSRDRILNAFLGRPVDRVPFGLSFGWSAWGETFDRWKRETGNPDLDVHRELDFDPGFAQPQVHYGAWPEFEHQILSEDEQFIISRDFRGITMKNRRDGSSMPDFIDYPVKSADDWERYKAQRLDPQQPGRIAEDLRAFKEQARDRAVQVGVFPWGIFGTVRDLLGAEELLIAFYDMPEVVQDMMNHLTTLWLHLYEQVANVVQIDHIHIWEDMSGRNGSLISPEMVEQFMMPCYARIVAFASECGAQLVSVDTDGDCSQLLPIMTGHGINMFLPFEVAAGNDVVQYRRQYPSLAILGGLDKRALAKGKAAIDIEVNRCREMIRIGRYIPSWDHLIPPDVSWDNYKYAAEQIRDVCRGQ